MRHTFREAASGLRRHLSMTLAVIVTIWVSLALFGAGLLTAMQVDLIKGKWYDKAEVSVFLCVKESNGGTCAGAPTTPAQREAVLKELEAQPNVQKPVFYENQLDAYTEFKKTYEGTPLVDTLGVDQIQDSFRVKLKDPAGYADVVAAAEKMPGVQNVQDLHTVLDPVFRWLDVLKWGTIGLSALLLVAAALQIGNSIRMAAFSRRRELGIMRLVGASTSYILLPFLIESLVAAVAGALLAAATIGGAFEGVILKRPRGDLSGLRWIGWHEVLLAMGAMGIVAIVLALIPTLASGRRHLRV